MSMLENFESMLQAGQDNLLLRFGLANEYFKQRAYAQAITHLQKALEFDPGYSAGWKLLGKVYMQSAQHEQARETFVRGINAAQLKGDRQAVKEMQVFLQRLDKL